VKAATRTHEATDDDLVQRARDGDERAFGQLVDRYESLVASTAIGMLGQGAEAEDVGQETFIRFHRSLDRFRGDSSVGTYLTRITINLALTAIKRRRRWFDRFKGSEAELAATAAPEDPEREFERLGAARRVHDGLARLGPEHRAVVVLRWIDGCSTQEAAEILGIPAGTVMSRLARAMGRLEAILKETAPRSRNASA
jgi:RNA polymerase sigma-70 factor (ECF subfamily)